MRTCDPEPLDQTQPQDIVSNPDTSHPASDETEPSVPLPPNARPPRQQAPWPSLPRHGTTRQPANAPVVVDARSGTGAAVQPGSWARLRLQVPRLPWDRLLDRYPRLPPAPEGQGARVAPGLVAMLAVAFAAFFIIYTALAHAAYATHAEDLGIIDQALWNTTNGHGHDLQQTICDVVDDITCLGDVPRTAIHFEPILLFFAPVYALLPSPLILVTIQAIVVASGAFPAYWIASRRLRSPWAGLAFAALYLLSPALQAALGVDFHAVTLAAALLLFALYGVLARNDLLLWVACLFAMTTNEEIPLIVIMIGLSIALLQRRRRLGLGLARCW